MSIQNLPEIVIVDQEDLKVISVKNYKKLLSNLDFYQKRHEWHEEEHQRLEDQIEALERDAFDYEQRNNSLEG